MRRNPGLREEGFILLELLVSVAILGAVLGAVYVLYFQGRQMVDAFSVRDRRLQSTSGFLERIQMDLNGFAGLVTDSAPPGLGQSEKKKEEEEEGTFIRMLSILQRGDAPSRPQVVTYYLKKDPGQDTGAIFRRERDPSADDEAADKELLILNGVSDVKVETYTSSWQEGWPAGGRGSKLLRLTLVSDQRGSHIETAAFTFELPQKGRTAAPASTFLGGPGTEGSDSEQDESGKSGDSADQPGQKGSSSLSEGN